MEESDSASKRNNVSAEIEEIQEQVSNCDVSSSPSKRSVTSPESNSSTADFQENDKCNTKDTKKKNLRHTQDKKSASKDENSDSKKPPKVVNEKNKKRNRKNKGDKLPIKSSANESTKREKKSKNLGGLFLPDKNPKKNKQRKNPKKSKHEKSKSDFTDDESNSLSPQSDNQTPTHTQNNSTVVVVVEDDETSNTEAIPKRKLFSSKEPLVYNCCVCCSLGAGALCGGIIFSLFCIAYLVVRAEEFKIRTVFGIWNGVHLLQDVWRVLLVIGFITASFCLMASVILIIASCLCGTKEKYNKIRFTIGLWLVATVTALVNNVGEAIFIQMMPNIKIDGFYHKSDRIEDIKSNNIRLWALTGLFTVFFIYITLVLVSYLRMLKYLDSPKIGTTQTRNDLELPDVAKSDEPRRKKQRGAERARILPENTRQGKMKGSNRSAPEILPRDAIEENRRSVANELSQEAHYPDDRAWKSEPRRLADASRLKSPGMDCEDSNRVYMNVALPENQPKRRQPKENNDAATHPTPKDTRNPKVPQRRPIPREEQSHHGEAIYVNDVQLLNDVDPQYTKVTKLQKRPLSPPIYQVPPDESDVTDSTKNDVTYQHPEIEKMERLAEELRKKQQAFDENGNCDQVSAERLTEMALTALRLSEKILQDVKTKDKFDIDSENAHVTNEKKPVDQDNTQLAEQFFEELANAPKSLCLNPIEELFHTYGKDLCSQNPEMVNRYLMSYKALQDGRNNRLMSVPPDTGIMDHVLNEQLPWVSIMNPSEAIPSEVQLTKTNSLPQPIQNMPQFLYSSQTPTDPPDRFLPISHSLGNAGEINPNWIDNENRSDQFARSRSSFGLNYNHNLSQHGTSQRSAIEYQYSDYYYQSECPCSQCNLYSDYYPSRSPMTDMYSCDAGVNDNPYSGENWFPMGDPAYSLDLYHNPYQVWRESPPPYTEESAIDLQPRRSRSSSSKASRGMRKSGSSKYSFEHVDFQDRGSLRDTLQSQSLPNIFQSSYSEGPSSPNRSRRSSRSRSRESDRKWRSRSQQSGNSNLSDVTTTKAFVKGYKMALKEALKMISTAESTGELDVIKRKDKTLDKESIASDRLLSKRKLSSRQNDDSRVSSSRGYTDDSNFGSCFLRDYGHPPETESDHLSSRKSTGATLSGRLSRTPRKTSKLSFRPSSRPQQQFFEDFYDGYRSDSSVPIERARSQDFKYSRKSSSRNSTRSTEDLSDASSKFGRPSTRSRLSSRLSQSTKGDKTWKDETDSNGAFSENDRHFYHKLNLERPQTAPPPISNPSFRNVGSLKRNFAHPRGQSAATFRGQGTDKGPRPVSEASKDDSELVWYMGGDPVYDIYDEGWNDESSSYPGHAVHRSSSFSDQPRLSSSTSSKRKSVTFDKRSQMK